MLNQFAVEIPTLPVDQCLSHLIRYLKGMLRHSFVSPRRKEGPPSIRDTHGIWGNVFLQIHLHLHQLLILWNWINGIRQSRSRSIHLVVEKSERSEKNQDLLCQSGPSAKDSVIFSGGDSSKNYGGRPTTTADFWSPLWQLPYSSDLCLLEDEVQDRGICTCSQFLTEAMQWIKEVELVDSVDEYKIFVIYSWYFDAEFLSTCLVRGLLQPWKRSSIIPNSKGESVWRYKKAQKAGPFLSWQARLLSLSTITSGSLGVQDSVENYADLFTISLRNDDIQEFDSKWDGILLSMTKFPHDDI